MNYISSSNVMSNHVILYLSSVFVDYTVTEYLSGEFCSADTLVRLGERSDKTEINTLEDPGQFHSARRRS